MLLKAKSYYNILIYSILEKQTRISKWRRDFFCEVFWLFLSISGRINFMQLGRYGKHGEQRYRQQFEKSFDFLTFNKNMVLANAGKHIVIAFDPSYIPKSGKHTPGLGRYWSGCAGKAKWGLEIGGIAAIDIENHTAFHLEAIQTPDANTLKKDSLNLLEWYAKLIAERSSSFIELSKYFVADAYFAKKPFADRIIKADLQLISRLRDDADMYYIYNGPKKPGKGRPNKFAGKINVNNINKEYFVLNSFDKDSHVYSAIVYSKALKRNIRIVFVEYMANGEKKSHKIYFSTDTELNANLILLYYHNRFQIEFLYRDAKQYTGLTDCQARDEKKLHFHFNISLSAINIAKIIHWLPIPISERKSFSLNDIKTLNHNALLLERFFVVFAVNPNSPKNIKAVKELLYFGTKAA